MKKAYLSPKLEEMTANANVLFASRPDFLGTDGDWGYEDEFLL